VIDLTPSMLDVLARIGGSSVTAHDMGVNGVVLKRLNEHGFLKVDMPREGYCAPWYSLSEMGVGAAAILNARPQPIDREGPVARIKRVVAGYYHIPEIEMVSARRSRMVARPRQVAMYLAKKLTPKSLTDIGRCFGNRDHSTVIHGISKVERLIEQDHNFKDEVTTLFRRLVSEEPRKTGTYQQQSDKTDEIPAFVQFQAGA
jgi:hypothetical protein